MLLRRDDLNPDKPDNGGRTPLWCAACNGHEGLVKIPLGRDDVDPNKSDTTKYRRTPLKIAASNRRRGVMALLQPRTSAGYNSISPRRLRPRPQSPH